MNRRVTVSTLDGQRHEVEYSPVGIISAPVHVARLAVAQEEARWLLENKRYFVLEQLKRVFVESYGPRSDLSNLQCGFYLEENSPDADGLGGFVWEWRVICDECDGSGVAYSRKGRDLECPFCCGSGHSHELFITTDSDGNFTGFPPTQVIVRGTESIDLHIEAMPLDEALEKAREFSS